MLRFWCIALLAVAIGHVRGDLDAPGAPNHGKLRQSSPLMPNPSAYWARKQPIWNDTWTDILRRDLLTTYDKVTKPNFGGATRVELGMTVMHMELDEIKSVFTVYGWIKMNWDDPKLRWNPADYGNQTVLHVGEHEIWQPDVLVYNSAAGHNIDYYGNTHCLVYPNGSVLWVPPAQLVVYCQLNLRNWPFDSQTCNIKMGSWTYDDTKLELVLGTVQDIDKLLDHAEWHLVGTNTVRNVVYYNCCVEPYADVNFEFQLQRRSAIYRAIVVTPATVVILLALASFWLPPTAGEKILLNGVNVVVIVSFLVYFARRLPTMGEHTPYVVLFFSNTLYMTAVSMVLSVLVLNISRNRHTRAVPWLVRGALDGWLGRVLLLQWLGLDVAAGGAETVRSSRTQELRENVAHQADEDDHAEDQHIIRNHLASDAVTAGNGGGGSSSGGKQGPHQRYWILLAVAVERLAFVVYAFVFVVMAAMYAV